MIFFLTKKEGNVNVSRYINGRGMNMSAYLIWNSHGRFSKITQTYTVKGNGFVFLFKCKCYILGIINSFIRFSKLILSYIISQMC